MCLILWLLDIQSFFSSNSAIWLSSYNLLSLTLNPCSRKKYLVHSIWLAPPLASTKSASVELLMFSFCLEDLLYTLPRPIDIMVQVRLRILSQTPYAASIHHLKIDVFVAESFRTRSSVPNKYCNNLFNFFQSPSFDLLILVVRNGIVTLISGLSLQHTSNILATILWNLFSV